MASRWAALALLGFSLAVLFSLSRLSAAPRAATPNLVASADVTNTTPLLAWEEPPTALPIPTMRGASSRAPVLVNLQALSINRTITAEVKNFEDRQGLRHFVFGIMSDGVLKDRLVAALSTWLRTACRVFVFFTDVEASRAAKPEIEKMFPRELVTVVLLPLPEERGPFSTWKNLAIVEYWTRPEVLESIFQAPSTGPSLPLVFCIADDDSYILAPATSFHMSEHISRLKIAHAARLQQQQRHKSWSAESLVLQNTTLAPRIYLGHIVAHCSKCRHVSKRFSFIYGGNGIFLSADVLLQLRRYLPQCKKTFLMLPGDTQIGGCIHRNRIANPVDLLVGTELVTACFGSYPEFAIQAPFPWAFHRVKDPSHARDIDRLEQRHLGKILVWDVLGKYFLEELGSKYQQEKWLFPKVNAG